MKKGLFFVLLCAVCLALPARAQKFGYVDSEFILGKMPEYQKALSEIDKFADKWSKDIQEKYAEIEKLQRSYQAEEILLTEDMKRDRQRVLSDKEREAREYNNKVFGYQGLLFEKKKELMKVPMELVNRAIEKVAVQKKLEFVFDKASDFTMLYTNPRHDYTDYIMEELGLDAANKPNKPTAVNAPTQPANGTPDNKTTIKPK
ncbi:MULTISPECIES: OmpH family outer membrane protein [Spirosoma]|uniref:OmpH family outer membrane protein n=1 Tax=Spirosoma liriopis TaxID=2937440 RepID=A0ABT0HJ92_9BACT|nr:MULTISPECIES: OmpH family outer membrane protein [Spirosoma]MCK8492229.1 OmpH family outer membrane protein [Spirosoma liriopis]UHG91644.1 OmpH family outer membrane protein [Spirosoma oryzicola]